MTEGNKQFLLVSNAMEMERVGRLGGLGEKALQTVVSAFSGPWDVRRRSMGRHRTFSAVSKCLIMMLMVRICCSLSYLNTKPMAQRRLQ